MAKVTIIKCPIDNVRDATEERVASASGASAIECPRCGSFQITDSASIEIERLKAHERIVISGWIRDQNDLGESPKITTYDLDRLKQLPTKPVAERIDRLLRAGIALQGTLGGHFDLNRPELVAKTYSADESDVGRLLEYLAEEDLMFPFGHQSARVTARGFVHGQTAVSVSSGAFIAMWFDERMTEARLGMQKAVAEAGYEPILVNAVEHINKIDDEIISQIRKSRFLIADFTGHRGGVYFEAGFALGLGLPVIWTCSKEDLNKLHFDVRQYNCIDWQDASDLAHRLQKRIEATIGRGPRQTNQAVA
jgi:hypothetical protein